MQPLKSQQLPQPVGASGSFADRLCASLNIPVPEFAKMPFAEQRPQPPAALEKARISPEARLLLQSHKLDIEKKISDAVLFMEPALRRHLDCIPQNLQLVWTVVTPATLDARKEDHTRFHWHKKKFTSWVGRKVLKICPELVVTVAVPNPGIGRGSKTFSLDRGDFLSMRDGVMPKDWSIEHIHPRSFSSPENNNRVGNLQIMPEAVNAWTARLLNLQGSINIISGQLALIAKPNPGPEQGHLIYGAGVPLIKDPGEIARMQKARIASLPNPKISRSFHFRAARPQLEDYP